MAKVVRVSNATRGSELGARVAVADNLWTRFIGLMGRSGLAEGEGLHIVPCGSVHMFAMRFALDIVYLDRQGKVVKTVRTLKPWRVSAARGAKTVLELPLGVIESSGTVVGDTLAISGSPASN